MTFMLVEKIKKIMKVLEIKIKLVKFNTRFCKLPFNNFRNVCKAIIPKRGIGRYFSFKIIYGTF